MHSRLKKVATPFSGRDVVARIILCLLTALDTYYQKYLNVTVYSTYCYCKEVELLTVEYVYQNANYFPRSEYTNQEVLSDIKPSSLCSANIKMFSII